jgi:hypothetical protein
MDVDERMTLHSYSTEQGDPQQAETVFRMPRAG